MRCLSVRHTGPLRRRATRSESSTLSISSKSAAAPRTQW